jgi:uncharacterized protein
VTPGDMAVRRRQYAAVVAALVATTAARVAALWKAQPAGRSFEQELATAGNGSTVYKSDRDALNSISDAIFYIEADTKDMKLGPPMGIRNCTKATCPEALESKYAGKSRDYLAANLRGFDRIFRGCSGPNDIGFDDLLNAVGAEAVASRIAVELDASHSAVAALPDPSLAVTLAENPVLLKTAYDPLRRMSRLLLTEFVTVLDLEVRGDLDRDND